MVVKYNSREIWPQRINYIFYILVQRLYFEYVWEKNHLLKQVIPLVYTRILENITISSFSYITFVIFSAHFFLFFDRQPNVIC